jgi:hypothetical protein
MSNILNAMKLGIDVIKRARGDDEAEVAREVCEFWNSGILMLPY